MRSAWVAVAISLTACASAPHVAVPAYELYKLTVEPDRFTGNTNLTYLGWEPTLNSGRPVLQLFGVLIPEKAASGAMLVFRSDNSGWRYLSCHQTHILADGTPVQLGNPEHYGDVRSGYVLEQVRVEVSLNALRDMAGATRLEARVCSDEVELNSIEITAIQDLVKALDSHNASLPAD